MSRGRNETIPREFGRRSFDRELALSKHTPLPEIRVEELGACRMFEVYRERNPDEFATTDPSDVSERIVFP